MTGAAAAFIGGAAAFSVSIPASVYKGGSGATSSGTVTTVAGAAAATVTGGVVPYTYLWSWVSGDAGISLLNGATSSAQFSATVHAVAERDAVYKLTVTDAVGHAIDSNPILVQLDWDDTR